jgi:hypothetical protein
LAPVFSEEYNTGAATIILTTEKGKNLLIRAKIIASFLFSTSIFVLFGFVYILFHGFAYGFSGADSHIQTSAYFLVSPYALTMGGLALRVFGIGYLGLLFLTSITLVVSAKSKNPYTTVIPLAGILFLPLVSFSQISEGLDRILKLFPVHIMWVSDIYPMALFYNVMGFLIDQATMSVIVSVLGIFLLIPISYRFFRTYQVKG